MARLIVIDARVAIAALSSSDAHHDAATAALTSADVDSELVLAATTRAEILVGPSSAGAIQRQRAQDFVDGCATVPITTQLADAAATLKATHRALSLPDAITLAVGDLIDADAIWTFDHRWRTVDPRVEMPRRPAGR